ncbi:BNR repeat-like domain-containing protein [Parapedobacter composti]|uniref:BNR repeat-like domain-containing protein n=1 Tax=Parapedobacter composti TaxID=623281 RepID=A0A1I1GUZ0_9SPHI|nr:exo-alpha-sialidase [Parapedobacter composti]SFC15305.1 BNR repeat-like domain-containing protein [Parapedobacter composti]
MKKRDMLNGLCLAAGLLWGADCHAQRDTVRYIDSVLANVEEHHGQLRLAVGVHNIQVLRANRERPDLAEGYGWTYNHAPMLAYWNGHFYLQHLADPVGEHIPPSQTYISSSADGYHWSTPQVVFPPYRIPDGYTKKGHPGVAKDLDAVMHQRMGFFVSRSGRLFTLGYYGIAMDEKDDPNDGNGIGRVVREIRKDGSYGPIHFIRYNASWDPAQSSYPFYKDSKDTGFVAACEELLTDPLMMMQWVEEADRDDPLIPLKKQYKAFSYYRLPGDRVVGLWKHALTAISEDGGRTWPENAVRAPGFVNSNAKIWGQRLSDGSYATVYNPAEYRWPLALSLSADGLNYRRLLLVNGEIPPMRYGGNYKSYGPQYVRGILEGNGAPPDGNLWVTYSMNKEDIWVSKVPVPVTDRPAGHADDGFAQLDGIQQLAAWNIYSPLWAPVTIGLDDSGMGYLRLADRDRYDYAKAERVIPQSEQVAVEFAVTAAQHTFGQLDFELAEGRGTASIRLTFDSTGVFRAKAGARYRKIMDYRAGQRYVVRVEADARNRLYTVSVNGKPLFTGIAFAPVRAFERVAFRTGGVRRFPDPDTPADQTYDLSDAGEPLPEASFRIDYLKTEGR